MKDPVSRKSIHRNIYYFCFLGISFFLPVFGKLVPPFIILLFLNWIVDAPYLKTFRLVFRERQRFLLLSFSFIYLVYLIGLFYSQNMKYAREDLEIKLSLLIFPVIFSTLEAGIPSRKETGRILNFFVIGSVLGTLFLLGHSWYNETWRHMDHAFYYSNLSWFFHPTYLSMYLAFSVAIIAWKITFAPERIRPLFKILMIILTIYFFILIILLSSKAGLISLSFVLVFFSALFIVRKKNWITGLVMLITSMLMLYMGLQYFPFVTDRISSAEKTLAASTPINSDSRGSTAERLMVWKSGIEIIMEHPIFGIGTGDVKDELLSRYDRNKILPALNKRLNAHCQYIQTFISIGIAGFLLLLGMIILPLAVAFRRQQYLYVIFLLIFAVNIAFESMFETQAGVVFYSFFNIVFFITRNNDPVDAE
jgi:O-antigen ligase